MRGGAWAHRRSYISRWIYQLSSLAERTTEMSKQQRNEDAYTSGLQEGDVLEEVMMQAGATMPSMKAVYEDLQHLEVPRDGKDKGDATKSTPEDEELEDLLDDSTPILPQQEFSAPEPGTSKVEVNDLDNEADEPDYEESFASQRETSQLREEIEVMSEQMKDLKATIAGVLKEREALPSHLSAIREDINRQMTLMLEKLHSSSEAEISTTGVHAVAASLDTVRQSSADRLAAAADYATDKPRQNSPLATPGAELKGKRRFRPVK